MKIKKVLPICIAIILSGVMVLSVGASDNFSVEIRDIVVNESGSTTNAVDAALTENPNGNIPALQSNLPYPTDVQMVSNGDRNYIYKTYSVSGDYIPDNLIEEKFSQGGYKYAFREIIQREHIQDKDSKVVTESQTVDCDTDNENEVFSKFTPTMPYSDGEGYSGELLPDKSTLRIEETGRNSYSYAVNETRTYPALQRNDLADIPKTITVNGRAMELLNVDWQETSTENAGYSEIPTGYTAVATYSGTANGSKVTGYTATIDYTGTVGKETVGKNIYTIVYEGEKIIIPIDYAPQVKGILIVVGSIAGILLGVYLYFKLRPSVTIYTMEDFVPIYYGKARIDYKNPVLHLNRVPDVPIRLVFRKHLAEKLYDEKVFIERRHDNCQTLVINSLVTELPAPELATKTDYPAISEIPISEEPNYFEETETTLYPAPSIQVNLESTNVPERLGDKSVDNALAFVLCIYLCISYSLG